MSRIRQNSAGLSRLIWTAGIVIGASLPHWTELPLWMPLMLLGAVAWRFGARLLRWPLPGRKTMWLLTVVFFTAVLLEYRTVNGLGPGSALLVVMVALKFLEARNQRDHILLTVISYFLVFASVLSGGSLLKGLYLLAFVWVTTLGLLQVGRQGPLLAIRPTAKLAGRLLLQSIPLMVVLFLLFPRLGPLWALPGDTSSGTSGLSGSMRPGDLTELGLSDEIAFRVDFTGQVPAASELYWRGPVLSKFDGRTWNQLDGMRGQVDDTVEYLGSTSEYRVMLTPDSRGWAFALEMPSSWANDNRRQSIRMASDYRLIVWPPAPGPERISYTVTSHSRYRAREPLSDSDIALFTRLPDNSNPRTRALVDQIVSDSEDAAEIIDRGLDVFRQEDFFYTLTPPALGEHTADDFIFDTKEGFCEHYASAFAIMMRMAGLPARVVTGYQGGELNSIGEYYVIRQSDAHAWTEVWTAEDGWMRVDPISAVAPERIAFGSARNVLPRQSTIGTRISRMPWLRQAALAWDAVNTFWNDWIVGYGPRLQRDLLEWLGFERPRWRQLAILTVIAVALVMAGLTGSLALRLRARSHRDSAAAAFARFNRLLKSVNVEAIRSGETPSAYGARAGRALPQYASQIQDVTRAYLTARYEPDTDGQALDRLKRLVAGFRPGYAPASR